MPEVLHLDSAAAGRASRVTRDAVSAHLALEAARGAYAAEEEAGETLATLRSGLARLWGVPDDGVALVESGTVALRTLLSAWPLSPGDRVGVAPSEWGPNLEALEHAGLEVVVLPADAAGHVDLVALPDALAGLALVHLDQVASHRGLVQPVTAIARTCAAHDVPVWVDAAQALGHREPVPGVAASYATSRKWLRGPRGVGVLAVAEQHWARLRVPPQRKHPDLGPVRLLESGESNVAGRVGLAAALDAYLDRGPALVRETLDHVGRDLARRLGEVPGWEVRAGEGPVVALAPLAGQDVVDVRARLLADHRVLTTASLAWRAPLDDGPGATLRLSPHLDVSDADLDRAVDALRSLGRV